MMEPDEVQQGSLFVRPKVGGGGRVYWDAQWRSRVGDGPWSQKTRRLGLAWQESDGNGGWRKRRGRCAEDHLDERAATVAALAAMQAQLDELQVAEETRRAVLDHKATVRELAFQWLEWLEEVRDAKPSTIADYRFLMREPGFKHKRGVGISPGRIMAAFGDRTYDEVTTAEVSHFLRSLDKEGLTPRNVNKHRQLLASIFQYACRDDTYQLTRNPAAGTDKRREDPPAALDYYEVNEVEALATAVTRGAHRWLPRLIDRLGAGESLLDATAATRVRVDALVAEAEINGFFAEILTKQGVSSTVLAELTSPEKGVVIEPDELVARAAEDRRDADTFRLLFYTGLRIGEVLPLRWADVDLSDRLLLVHRGVSNGQETLPKGRRHRFVPLSMPAVDTLERLRARQDFIQPEDYVVCNRLGRRLDPSAIRRRYKSGCAATGLRPVKLHGLRHAAGSLIARTADPVFVRDFLGHSKLTTTDRYLSSKLRPEEFERLDRAFGVSPNRATANENVEPL